MFAINEIAPNGTSTTQSQSQHAVIASVMAMQRVIAGQAGAQSGDAGGRSFGSSHERQRADRQMETPPQAAQDDAQSSSGASEKARSAAARSIFEAAEASRAETAITEAFQARHGLNDLLSVIRDPDDRMLPRSPEN